MAPENGVDVMSSLTENIVSSMEHVINKIQKDSSTVLEDYKSAVRE